MDSRKKEQLKIALILHDLGLNRELIQVMTSLTLEELNKIYQ